MRSCSSRIVVAPFDYVKRYVASLDESVPGSLFRFRVETQTTVSVEGRVQIPDRDDRRHTLEFDFSGHATSL
jgi:hypothetical protein